MSTHTSSMCVRVRMRVRMRVRRRRVSVGAGVETGPPLLTAAAATGVCS